MDDEGLLPDFLKDSLTNRARLMHSDPSDLAEREEEEGTEEMEEEAPGRSPPHKSQAVTIHTPHLWYSVEVSGLGATNSRCGYVYVYGLVEKEKLYRSCSLQLVWSGVTTDHSAPSVNLPRKISKALRPSSTLTMRK